MCRFTIWHSKGPQSKEIVSNEFNFYPSFSRVKKRGNGTDPCLNLSPFSLGIDARDACHDIIEGRIFSLSLSVSTREVEGRDV